MDPHLLIPTAEAIPVPWGWFHVLLLLTFTLHILLMNIMLGTAVLVGVNSFRPSPEGLAALKRHAQKLPITIALTVNFGVAPLLFAQVLYGQFIYSSSVLMAAYWLSIPGILIIAYYGAYIYTYKFEILGASRGLLMLSCSALFLIIAFFFTNNMTLMLDPQVWARYFDAPHGLLLNLQEPSLAPRYVHFIVASIAIGGLFQATMARFDNATSPEKEREGMRIFALASLLQFPVGIWFLVNLPQPVRLAFMGSDSVATIMFLAALTCALIAIGMAFMQRFYLTLIFLIGTIAGMVLTRDTLRRIMLAPYFDPQRIPVQNEYSSLTLFVITLILGLGLIIFMLSLPHKGALEAK